MMRYSTSFYSVPRAGQPGTYMIYAAVEVWDDDVCCTSFEVGRKLVTDMPEVHTTTDVTEWAVDWADTFYKIATEIYASVKTRDESEVNARPASASTN